MKDDKQQQTEPKDVALDVPAEANTEKHINFVKLEERGNSAADSDTDDTLTERQKEWQEGLEAGKRARQDDAS